MPILINDTTIYGLVLKKSGLKADSFERVGKMWISMNASRPQHPSANSSSGASDSEPDSSSDFVVEDPEKN